MKCEFCPSAVLCCCSTQKINLSFPYCVLLRLLISQWNLKTLNIIQYFFYFYFLFIEESRHRLALLLFQELLKHKAISKMLLGLDYLHHKEEYGLHFVMHTMVFPRELILPHINHLLIINIPLLVSLFGYTCVAAGLELVIEASIRKKTGSKDGHSYCSIFCDNYFIT